MHLLNAAVAVTAALVGTVGATVAYGTLNMSPVVRPEPSVQAVTITEYLPCEPPATLTDGVCLTTVVKTVVKTPKPIVVTVADGNRSSASKSGTSSKTTTRDRDDDEHEDEDHDHEDEDHVED